MNNEPANLEEQGDIDWSRANQQKTGRGRSRAIVSVAFSRDDFDRLDRHVERRGIKISEFIREAALDRVAAEQSPVTIGAAFAAAAYYAPAAKADFSPPSTAGTAAPIASRFVPQVA